MYGQEETFELRALPEGTPARGGWPVVLTSPPGETPIGNDNVEANVIGTAPPAASACKMAVAKSIKPG